MASPRRAWASPPPITISTVISISSKQILPATHPRFTTISAAPISRTPPTRAASASTPNISAGAAAFSTWTTTAGPTFSFATATSILKSSSSRPKPATRSASCFTRICATGASMMFPTTPGRASPRLPPRAGAPSATSTTTATSMSSSTPSTIFPSFCAAIHAPPTIGSRSRPSALNRIAAASARASNASRIFPARRVCIRKLTKCAAAAAIFRRTISASTSGSAKPKTSTSSKSAGPADLDPIDLGGGTEPEVDAHVATGNVTGPATNFVDERARTGFHRDLRADAVAIGFAANGLKRNPMIAVVNVVYQQHGRSVHIADDRGHAAIVPQIADRQSARRTHRRNPRPRIGGNIGEFPVAVVVIQNLRLFEIAAEVLAVHFGVDVTVGQEQIGPAVVVNIEKHDAPAKILRVQAETGGESFVVERGVAIVVVESRGIVGKICLEQIEPAIAIVVRDGGAHAGLLAPVIIKRRARNNGDVRESAVVIVMVENAGGAVARDINVRPAVVVIVERGNTEGIMTVGLIDARFCGDVLKRAVPEIVIKNVFRPRQATRAAHHRNTFPHAGRPLTRRERGGGIIIDVIGDH